MRNIIYCVFSVFLLVACSNVGTKQESKVEEKKKALAVMLDSCFIAQPNIMNNDITRSIFADTITAIFQRYRGKQLPYIADLPVRYEMCLEYKRHFENFEASVDRNAGKYVVKFGFGKYSSNCKLSDDYETTFQVFALLDKQTASELIEDSLYYIGGIFRDFSNNSSETGFILPDGKCLISYPTVTTSSFNKPFIDLGTLIIDSLTFTKIP